MAENGSTLPHDPATDNQGFAESKGKGKAVAEDVPRDEEMDEDDEDESESDEDENLEDEEDDGDDGDLMGKIDLNNIVEGGRRTRGAKIDYAKAAEENPADEDDDEDDEEFEPSSGAHTGGDTEMSG